MLESNVRFCCVFVYMFVWWDCQAQKNKKNICLYYDFLAIHKKTDKLWTKRERNGIILCRNKQTTKQDILLSGFGTKEKRRLRRFSRLIFYTNLRPHSTFHTRSQRNLAPRSPLKKLTNITHNNGKAKKKNQKPNPSICEAIEAKHNGNE